MDELKPVEWLGTSRTDIRTFPDKVRQLFGTELMALQAGYNPADWKPIPDIVIYTANFADAIYGLHAFRKKSQKTSRRDIELARSRLKLIKR